ncbi:hypothetical protein PF003_g17354 [Phytophthora fragariae]|nr:hypothetical protein PF003_g17354 [Phytophthora fragariae]
MLGPLVHRELKALDDTKHEKLGRFAISHDAAQAHVTSLDLWVCDSLAELPKAQKQSVIVAVARTYVLAASGIDDLVVSEALAYPVTPKELCATSMPQFSEIIKSLRPRLADALGEAQIDTIAAELRALHKYHADSKSFRDVIAAFDHRLATFDSMWLLGGAGKRFPHLAAFCGTLASVFPNTATVESDFSIIVCEKTDKRSCLTDLSLEGILHCKQWQRLRSIKTVDGSSV